MGLHQRHTHGRVYRGEDAREQLRIRKRDSHGDSIVFHVPEGFAAKQVADTANTADTVASIVYVTLPQTFEGPAMYSTLTGEYNPYTTAVPTSVVDNSPNFYTGPAIARSSSTMTDAEPTETSTRAATSTVTPQSSVRTSVVGGTPIQAQATRAPTASSSASPESQSQELSGGAKAGIAIGVILGIGLLCGLLFFCWRRKKSGKKQQEALNEKHGSFADVGARRAEADGMSHTMAGGMAAGGAVGAAAAANKRDSVASSLRSSRSTSTAPRLSLRPVTQFLPMLGDNKSDGNVNGANGSNPFADASDNRPDTARSNPFDEQRRSNESLNGAAAAAGVAGAAGVAAAAHANGPKQRPEPAKANNAQPGSAAGAAAGVRQPNNVHRVQLDFKPSMDDELELVSGALVRLLHEYDDGWALCISMDRSKQGVAPRTCLSKLPVKPRPQGPPPPQGYRPGPGQQQGPPRGPPQGARRPSNASATNGPPGAMQPRPLTPQSTRTPSPTEQMSSDVAPAGPQAPKRKPVPGMAM